MRVNFVARLMNVCQETAGEFELAAGFECYGTATLFEGNDFAVFEDRRPAESLKAGKHGLDAIIAVVLKRSTGFKMVSKLLVLARS